MSLAPAHEIISYAGNGNGTFTQSNGNNNATTLIIGSEFTNSGAGTYNLQGGNLTTTGTQSLGNGSFTQTGGNNTLNGGTFAMGVVSAGNANYLLQSGNLTANNALEAVGYSGNGNFTQTGGTNFLNFNSNLYVGYALGSNGNYSLQNGTLSISIGSETIGNNGNGTFTQTGGTNVVTNASSSLHIAAIAGSSGTYNLQAGNLTASNEMVGDYGTGNFSHTGGNNTISGNLTIGNQNSGSYLLDNNASLAAAAESIGAAGNGNFTQYNGTNAVSASFVVGNFIGSTGNYTLANGNLTLTGATNEIIGNDGTATFVQNAGNNTIGGALYLAYDFSAGLARYTLNGGNLTTTGNELIGYSNSANFTQNGGVNTLGGSLFVSVWFTPTSYLLAAGTINATNVTVESAGTLTINSGLVNASTGTLQIFAPSGNFAGGTVIFTGGTLNIAALNTTGIPSNFQWTGGTLGLTAGVTFDPAASLGSTSSSFGNALTLNSGMSLIVTGNETIGGAGFFSLTLNKGALDTASGALTIAPAGILYQNGAPMNQNLLNQGGFTYGGGTFTGQVTNTGTATFLASFSPSNPLINSGTIAALPVGVTLTLFGSGLTNSGAVSLSGGSINGTINNSGLITGYGSLGSLTSAFTNTGVITQAGGNLLISTNLAPATNSGTFNLASGLTLQLTSVTVTNDGTFNLNSGTLNTASLFTNNADGVVIGPGKLVIPAFFNFGTLEVPNGPTTTSNFTNSGLIEMAGAGRTSAPQRRSSPMPESRPSKASER